MPSRRSPAQATPSYEVLRSLLRLTQGYKNLRSSELMFALHLLFDGENKFCSSLCIHWNLVKYSLLTHWLSIQLLEMCVVSSSSKVNSLLSQFCDHVASNFPWSFIIYSSYLDVCFTAIVYKVFLYRLDLFELLVNDPEIFALFVFSVLGSPVILRLLRASLS